MISFNGIFLVLLQTQDILMRSDKIGAVLAVILVIFTLVITYLVLTNRKVNQLEQKLQDIASKE